ncbi:hypothetical protein NPIL_593801 [Nephila pilipes]|uniref:Uncharacterized protein n=1 Tax=Nephila pilipes TaxID=299642 RepID=A0A8X6NLB4_NEPPI|nr:hypothetical protein NPIL_593801 [Nephila pilipes]
MPFFPSFRTVCRSKTETRWPMTSTFQYLRGTLDIDNAKTSIFHLSITQQNFDIFERIPELRRIKGTKKIQRKKRKKYPASDGTKVPAFWLPSNSFQSGIRKKKIAGDLFPLLTTFIQGSYVRCP